MNVLVACEESQRVCIEFRKKGHNAFSCDIEEPSGGHPEWHIHDDVIPILNGGDFYTMEGKHHLVPKWDILIAHPPCTYLTVSANKYYNVNVYGDKARKRYSQRYKAIVFFMRFILAPVERICVENPIGIMSTCYKKPSQIIQPFEYGHHARKATCLWLKKLPLLRPTKIVNPGEITSTGFSVGAYADGRDENGKFLRFNDPYLSKLRSKTFSGIAKAMAEQWG